MTRLAWIAAGAAAFVAGCASAPDKIQASYVGDDAYARLSCAQVAAEHAHIDDALARRSDAQRRARTIDTIGVALAGVPAASLLGANHSREIAQLKGEQAAIGRQEQSERCSTTVGVAADTTDRDTPIATALRR